MTKLEPDQALDLDIMKQTIDLALFERVERDVVHKTPDFYERVLDVSTYVAKDYAQKEARQKSLIAHAEAAVPMTSNFQTNLRLPSLALREEAKRRLGDRFSLQRFHDALLSHGTPPLALIHDRVLADPGVPNATR